jgi:hypothetical protein
MIARGNSVVDNCRSTDEADFRFNFISGYFDRHLGLVFTLENVGISAWAITRDVSAI